MIETLLSLIVGGIVAVTFVLLAFGFMRWLDRAL